METKYNNIESKTPEYPEIFKEPRAEVEKYPFRPAPTSSASYGEHGWLAYDENYIYVYIKSKGWRRRPIDQFDYDETVNTYITGTDSCGNLTYSTTVRPINNAFRVFRRFSDSFYHNVPYNSNEYGEDGWISYSGDYFYIYSAGMWRRIPINIIGDSF